ncbi:hypothetical protein OG496_54725 [Streptomyces sp. NBC_00988]|uniref:hypothetical protein n=1 Tax=Streptomyces sp. NBC_00988 TaxID=2903704 RepID=UPI0038667CAC|nr:hypothetical protein OG496_54725 [Streptomyces sp. NBC_00988]
MFIFTTYVTLPLLCHVGSTDEHGAPMLRRIVGGGREKEFLVCLIGIGDQSVPDGGIANPMVRRLLTDLGNLHRDFQGMHGEYLDFFAGVIALSCLRTATFLKLTLNVDDCHRYWRYLRHSLMLFGAELGDWEAVSEDCERFVARHAGADYRTKANLTQLFTAHPEHMATCSGTLFPESRRVVATTMSAQLPAEWVSR